MSLSLCTIHPSPRTEKSIFLSSELARALNIAGSRSIVLRIGSKALTVTIRTIKKAGLHLYLPSPVIHSLKLPRTGPCLIHSPQGKELRLGPLIGIVTTMSVNSSMPFGSRTPFFKKLMQTGSGKSFFIAFSPSNVDWQRETVYGYMLGPSGRFVRKTVPIPDVIYNRISSRRAEKQASMEGFKDRFVRRDIPIFNWSFFDKSDIYRLLERDEGFKHVPESAVNPSPTKLKEMLHKHRFVYLKPTSGSLGFGIYRITYHPNRGYFIRYRQNSKNILLRFKDFDGILRMLGVGRGGLNRYVAQQGIRLIEIDNCPIDFRFHMTKNRNNMWEVAAIGAKKAGRGSVTTHIRTGGSLFTPEQVLKEVYGARSEVVLSNAKETAIRLAEAIERNYPHRLGELGFDIGIDQREQLWMFEANSKPGRTIFKHPSLKASEKTSLENIYEHCLFLTRFSDNEQTESATAPSRMQRLGVPRKLLGEG